MEGLPQTSSALVSWFINLFVIALIINVAGAYLVRILDTQGSKLFGYWNKQATRRRERFEKDVQMGLTEQGLVLMQLRQVTNIVFGMMWLIAAVAPAIAIAMWFPTNEFVRVVLMVGSIVVVSVLVVLIRSGWYHNSVVNEVYAQIDDSGVHTMIDKAEELLREMQEDSIEGRQILTELRELQEGLNAVSGNEEDASKSSNNISHSHK